jgi:predicted ArsR family transcriptional regulator
VAVDELDRQIVAALVADARATYADVGARVGLSAPAVKRRVDRLRASGAAATSPPPGAAATSPPPGPAGASPAPGK